MEPIFNDLSKMMLSSSEIASICDVTPKTVRGWFRNKSIKDLSLDEDMYHCTTLEQLCLFAKKNPKYAPSISMFALRLFGLCISQLSDNVSDMIWYAYCNGASIYSNGSTSDMMTDFDVIKEHYGSSSQAIARILTFNAVDQCLLKEKK